MKHRVAATCNSPPKRKVSRTWLERWPCMAVVDGTTSSMFQAPSRNECNEAPFFMTHTSMRYLPACIDRFAFASEKLAIHAQRAQARKIRAASLAQDYPPKIPPHTPSAQTREEQHARQIESELPQGFNVFYMDLPPI